MSSNLYTIPQRWTPDQMSSTSHLRSSGPQTHSQSANEFLGYHQNTSGSGDPTTSVGVGQVLQEANDNLRAGAGSSSQLEVRQGEEPPVEYELNGIKGTIAYPHQITRSKYKKLGDMGILPAELQVLYDNRSKNALLANQRRAEGAAIAEGEQAYHHRYGEPHWYNVNGSKSTRHRTQKRLYREGKMTPEQANQFELNQITYGPLRPNLQRYWFPELPSKKPETQREVVKSARSKCEWATSRSEIKEILLNEYQQADLRVPEGGRTFGKQAYKIAVYWAEKRWVEKHAKAAQGHATAGGH